MASRKDQVILAFLGAAALAQYAALQAQAHQTEPALRHSNSCDRTDALIDEWLRLRPEAELAARFYDVTDGITKARKRRRHHIDPDQLQFFQEPLFAVAAFYRRVGADLATGCANARRLSAALEDEAARWLRVLGAQHGRWNEDQNLDIAQAIGALHFLANADHEWLDWQPLEILGDHEITELRPGEIEVSLRVYNPNDFDSPIPAFYLLFLGLGGAMVLWPKQASVPPLRSVSMKVRVSATDARCKLEVRFARSHELSGSN